MEPKGRSISSNGHRQVDKLPRKPETGVSYWLGSPNGRHEYTHSLFRFPAKFHPPIVRWALDLYGRKDSVVLDPFTGSGTVQVEALVRGVPSIGFDIDPLACLVTQVKTTPIDPQSLRKGLDEIRGMLEPFVRAHLEQELLPGADISDEQFDKESIGLSIPSILNITHWFRRYVIIDLARVLNAIDKQAQIGDAERLFFRACLASVIRRVSNADPAPVSGLEVTHIQAKKNMTRKITVFKDFFAKTEKEIRGMSDLWETLSSRKNGVTSTVVLGDTIETLKLWKNTQTQKFSLVITSPPYCRSVEYSRRHQLEMYWLGFVNDQIEHVALAHSYIGRKLVRASDWDEQADFGIKQLDDTIHQITSVDSKKGRTVRHYFYSMRKVFAALTEVITKTATLVCVVGDSVCSKVPIPTADFIADIASEHFEQKNRFSYALRNHYMQYGLWNGEGIKQEHVLVMNRK